MYSDPRRQTQQRCSQRFVYIAGPWGAFGGGMFRVADYLIQAQRRPGNKHAAILQPLDTRGAGSAISSIGVLFISVLRIIRGRMSGQLAGVHVNVAERLSVFRKSVVVVACRMVGIPVVLHVHAAQLPPFYRGLPSLVRKLVRWVFSLPVTDVVLGPSARRFVIEELLVPPHKVQIVLNGVPEPSVARRRASATQRTQRVLFLGNLSERKGVSDLLRALALPVLNRALLVVDIAGGGDIRRYQALARELGVSDRVRFTGWVEQGTATQLLADADVLVLPSYDEGLPLVILEAMSHGVAVVCTPVGEIPSMLSDGLTACFVQPGNPSDIAFGLNKVLRQPGFRAVLERNGRVAYEARFSLSAFSNRIADIHRRAFGLGPTQGCDKASLSGAVS